MNIVKKCYELSPPQGIMVVFSFSNKILMTGVPIELKRASVQCEKLKL